LPALAIPTPAVAAVAAAAALLAALVPVTSAASARFAVHARSCSSSKAASGARPAPRAQSGARMARLPARATISRATGEVGEPAGGQCELARLRRGLLDSQDLHPPAVEQGPCPRIRAHAPDVGADLLGGQSPVDAGLGGGQLRGIRGRRVVLGGEGGRARVE